MNPSDSTNKPLALPAASLPVLTDSTLVQANTLVPAGLHAAGVTAPRLPDAVAGTPTLAGLAQALRRRWPLALGLAVVAAVVAVVGVFTVMPGQYPAQVRILVSSRGEAKVFGEANDEPDFLLYKANMAAMVKSQMVVQAALNQKTSTGKEVKDLGLIREQGVEWLEFALKTDFLLGPEILKVVLNTDRPDEGAELLNAIARAFVEENYLKDTERRDKRVKDFKENLAKLENDLNNLRIQLRARENNLAIPDEKIRVAQYTAAYQQQVKAGEAVTVNRTEQIKAREELTGAMERLQGIGRLTITQEKIDESFRKDERAQELFLAAKKIDKEISDTRANGTEDFVAGQLRNLESKKQQLAQRVADFKTQLRPDYESIWRNKMTEDLQDRIRLLQENVTTLEKQAPALKAELKRMEDEARLLAPSAQVPLEIIGLQSKITNLEASVGDVSKTIQKMVAELVNPRVSILQLASEPKSKDYSRQTKLAGAGGLCMFFLAVFGVALLEFQARKISGADEVSHGLGLNIVGSLPAMPLSARKFAAGGAAPQNTLRQNQLNEAVDGIRTMLLHASRSENLRVIMVTSATSGEGKTSVASQLAASLARAWRKTLLIDGDLRKPAAHQVFDIAQEPGFSELLRNEVSANDAVKPTSLSRLWLMPAGHFDSHALQALAQDNMRALFDQLKEQYDFIIVDSCPILPVADALLLGQHVDGVIFSILRDVSRAPAVHAAQQKINNLAIRTLGAVMIGAGSDMADQGYAYAGSNP